MTVKNLCFDSYPAEIHLDPGVDEPQRSLRVTIHVRLNVLAHDLHVLLRHRPPSISRGVGSAKWRAVARGPAIESCRDPGLGRADGAAADGERVAGARR